MNNDIFTRMLTEQSKEYTENLLLYLENITSQIILQTICVRQSIQQQDDVNWVKEGF